MSKKYIIGLGNYAMNDDGIGLRVVEQIVEKNLDDGFEAVEVGNDGIKVLTYFTEETERILFVDCALIDQEPGEFMIFTPEEVITKKVVDNVSTHEGDVLKLIELGKQVDAHIPDILIMAIQPESMEMDMTLSQTLADRLDEYVAVALKGITS